MKSTLFILAAVALAGTGCTKAQWDKARQPHTDFKYHSGTEIPPGPGAFSGKKGYWELEPPLDIFEAETTDPNEVRKVRRKD